MAQTDQLGIAPPETLAVARPSAQPAGRRWRLAALLVGALAAVLYPIPFQLEGSTYFQTVGFLVLINAMLGVGWNIIGGWTGQFDFGPQVFFAIGAYVEALLLEKLGTNSWLNLLVAVLVAVVICAVLTYPITRLRGHYFAIATVAIWMIAIPIGSTWEFINGSLGMFIPFRASSWPFEQALNIQFGGRTKELGYYYVCLALFALVLWLAHVVQHSKFGFYFQAIRDDQDGAEGIGINSRLYKMIARCMTAAVFATGGALYGLWALAVYPDQVLDVNWGTLPTISVVVGGIGRLWGPLVGALLLVPLSQFMSTNLGTGPLAGRGIDLIVYGIIIMAIAAGRPNGLLSLPWGRWARRLVPGTSGDRRGAR
jgi:branched-chain amino acid transport system permease protein